MMALGLYTILPGFARWDDDGIKYLAPMLPPVGLLLGALWLGLAALAERFLPVQMTTVVISLSLPALTGFLHLDGFMDVSDALLSARPREEKLRILKDPHAGAFAVIALCCLLIAQTAAANALLEWDRSLVALLGLPVISRALAALTLMTIPPLPQSAYGKLHYEGATAAKRQLCALFLAMAVIGVFLLSWRGGIACLVGAAAYGAACAAATRTLGGMNGDIAGWSICWAEMMGLAALACL